MFACPICLDIIKEADSANDVNSHVMTTLCGHVFHRRCITDCLSRKSRCPSCNKDCYIQQIIRLFPTGDQENERLIRDMQVQVEIKTQENWALQKKINSHTNEIDKQQQVNLRLRYSLESKNQEYGKMHNELKIMGIDAKSKQATLNSLRTNFDALKLERDEKVKELIKTEADLEALKKVTCGPEQYEKSKERYRALLARFEKTVDEKILAIDRLKEMEIERDILIKSSASLRTQYETLLEQNVNDPEATKADKERYNKLLDRFEKLTDQKNAIVHEKLKMEQEFKTFKVTHSTTDKLKDDHAELQRKFQNLESEITAKVEESSKLKTENMELKKKAEGLNRAQIALEKVSTALNEAKKEHEKVIDNMKANTSKLYTQKEKAVNELKSLRKSRLENSTSISNLGIGQADGSMDYSELEKKYLEVKTARNRLIRESNRNKQRGDNVAIENTRLIEKIKRLEETITKLKAVSNMSQDNVPDAKFMTDITKQTQMIHHCNQLLSIVKSYSN